MINIGIDFGSTYTMVSVYEGDTPETVQPDGLSYSYPSIVVYDKKIDRYFFGKAASAKMSGKNTVAFRGFKMLLNHQMDQENLRKRGYDEVNTPEHITELFLRYVIQNTLKKKGEDNVGTLVIGAPECWFQSIDTIDSRSILRKICSSMTDIVGKVKIVSEPTNAAAFSVWNYEKESQGDTLGGRILVVDYGGGTLDTALVEVHQQNGSLQIKPEMRSGAGENHDHEIGNAGIAYQEAVARLAISEATGIPAEEIPCDAAFNKFIKEFEEQLLSQSNTIKDIMESYEFDIDGLNNEYFCEMDYGTESIEINFFHLYDAYQTVIAPVLKRVLDDTSKDIELDDNLHIALVGGFCNFYLVEKQIYKYFNISERDNRVKGMIREEADREKAIAHGASLFASDVISVCNVAQFSIGTYAVFPDGRRFNRYAINLGEEIDVDTVYFALDDNGNPYPMTSGDIDKFLLNFSKRHNTAMDMCPKQKFAERLRNIKSKCGDVVIVGFSMDTEERITIYVYNYDTVNGQRDEYPVDRLTLSTLKDMFGSIVLPGLGG